RYATRVGEPGGYGSRDGDRTRSASAHLRAVRARCLGSSLWRPWSGPVYREENGGRIRRCHRRADQVGDRLDLHGRHYAPATEGARCRSCWLRTTRTRVWCWSPSFGAQGTRWRRLSTERTRWSAFAEGVTPH